MAGPVSFFVGTPNDDGRIQEVRMIPPPPPAAPNITYVLLWNPTTLEPQWTDVSNVSIPTRPVATYLPLTTDTGKFLVTDTGARLVVTKAS